MRSKRRSARQSFITLPTNVKVPEGGLEVGGLPPAQSPSGILNTVNVTVTAPSECKHGETGLCVKCFYEAVDAVEKDHGSYTAPQGWRCPSCSNTYAPHVLFCPVCYSADGKPWNPKGDCACPPNGICMSTACPRRTVVTYST